jgi:hypothetical protein
MRKPTFWSAGKGNLTVNTATALMTRLRAHISAVAVLIVNLHHPIYTTRRAAPVPTRPTARSVAARRLPSIRHALSAASSACGGALSASSADTAPACAPHCARPDHDPAPAVKTALRTESSAPSPSSAQVWLVLVEPSDAAADDLGEDTAVDQLGGVGVAELLDADLDSEAAVPPPPIAGCVVGQRRAAAVDRHADQRPGRAPRSD